MGEEPLTVSATMTRAEQENALKERVLAYMRQNLEYDEQGIILYQDSDPVYYGEDDQWNLDTQTVVQNEDGRVRTTTVLDRELGAPPAPRRYVRGRTPAQRGHPGFAGRLRCCAVVCPAWGCR